MLPSTKRICRTLVAVLPAIVLGLAWQGSRGLWEPDEGRNTNIALGMLESGDWLVPRLNGDPYLDKPPLHFWSVAASMKLLGVNEWGARVPSALFFVATAALVCALGRRMWDQRAGRWSAWVYATTLAPFAAANVVTPDTALAAFVMLLVYAYWRAECDGARAQARRRWWVLAGVAVGLGLLTKGPAVLVFLPPLAAHAAIRWRHREASLGPGPWLALAVAALLGLTWYLPIVRSLPDAGAYLLDNQAVGRLVGSRWDRSPGWAGARQGVPADLGGRCPPLVFLVVGKRSWPEPATSFLVECPGAPARTVDRVAAGRLRARELAPAALPATPVRTPSRSPPGALWRWPGAKHRRRGAGGPPPC